MGATCSLIRRRHLMPQPHAAEDLAYILQQTPRSCGTHSSNACDTTRPCDRNTRNAL